MSTTLANPMAENEIFDFISLFNNKTNEPEA